MILYSTCGQSRQLTSPLAPAMKKARYGKQRERAESVIWLLRNSIGDSCCYTWSDSLPLQLCGPHVQYDFTTSSMSLEIPSSFFFSKEPSRPLLSCQFAGGVVLTQRQVHVLVTLLFPERLRISLRLESARTVRHKNVFQSHVLSYSELHGVTVLLLFTQLASAALRCQQPGASSDFSPCDTRVTQRF